MKKNRTAAKSTADAVMRRVAVKPNMRTWTWYDRITDGQRAVVDEVVRRCAGKPDARWYVVAESLIETLGIPAKQKRVAEVLRELAARGK